MGPVPPGGAPPPPPSIETPLSGRDEGPTTPTAPSPAARSAPAERKVSAVAAVLASVPVASALAGPELCATIKELREAGGRPVTPAMAEARPWESEHVRALFPEQQMESHVAATRAALGLADAVDAKLLATATALLDEVAS